eukprot:TCONS_00040876-protein
MWQHQYQHLWYPAVLQTLETNAINTETPKQHHYNLRARKRPASTTPGQRKSEKDHWKQVKKSKLEKGPSQTATQPIRSPKIKGQKQTIATNGVSKSCHVSVIDVFPRLFLRLRKGF